MNEKKLCPMKYSHSNVMGTTLSCYGANCAWWLEYHPIIAAQLNESGRCAILAIKDNLSDIAMNAGGLS